VSAPRLTDHERGVLLASIRDWLHGIELQLDRLEREDANPRSLYPDVAFLVLSTCQVRNTCGVPRAHLPQLKPELDGFDAKYPQLAHVRNVLLHSAEYDHGTGRVAGLRYKFTFTDGPNGIVAMEGAPDLPFMAAGRDAMALGELTRETIVKDSAPSP
jgi:hypothetical protein